MARADFAKVGTVLQRCLPGRDTGALTLNSTFRALRTKQERYERNSHSARTSQHTNNDVPLVELNIDNVCTRAGMASTVVMPQTQCVTELVLHCGVNGGGIATRDFHEG